MKYIIKRGASDLITVSPKGWQTKQAMGARTVDMTFTLFEPVEFKKGDWCTVYGERYEININPTFVKTSERQFEYTVQLEHESYRLREITMLGYDSSNNLTEPVHNLSADAYGHMSLLIANANRISSGWMLGVVDATDLRHIEYKADSDNLLAVLNRLTSEFETEYWIENKTIHLTKRTGDMGITLGYGKGKGFLSVKKTNKDNSFIATRLYVEGGETNIESGYRGGKKALQLPVAYPYIQDAAKVAEYGVIEAYAQFPDIFPRRTGTVTAVEAGQNFNAFYDSAIDFDVNDVLVPDADAKVIFKTGLLAGYEFTLASFNNGTKKFVFNQNESEKDFDIPSDTLRPAVGDTYVLVNINMPQPHKTNAENELYQAGLEHYDKISDVLFNDKFEVACDRIQFKKRAIEPILGYTIRLFETNPPIDVNRRISSIKRSLENAWDYELELTDNITLGAVAIANIERQKVKTVVLGVSGGNGGANGFLGTLSGNNGYIFISGSKAKAGYADQAGDAAHAVNADLAVMSQTAREVISADYVPGLLGVGHKMVNGDIEANNLSIRGTLTAYEFLIKKARSIGGSFMVSAGAKIKNIISASGSIYVIDVENDLGVEFAVDDIIVCQKMNGPNQKQYTAQVTAISTNSFTINKISGAGIPAAGDELVQVDNLTNADRKGLLYLTNSDTGAPYLDVAYGYFTNPSTRTKVRLGRLDGIIDADFGALSGWGLYGENVYLRNGKFKGEIIVTGGNAATTADVSNLQNQLTEVDGDLALMVNDNKATPDKKQKIIKPNYDKAAGEVEYYKSQAAALGVSSTNYNNAFLALQGYVPPIIADLNTTSDINGSLLRSYFNTYYTELILLDTAIKNAQKGLSDQANTSATTANNKIDNLKIGGVNLLDNSAGPFTSAGNNEYTKIGVHALFATLVGKTVTISFKLKSAIEGSFQFYTLGRYGIGSTIFQATTDFQQYKKTVTITDVNPAQTFTDLSFFGTYGTGRILTVKEVMIEEGNIASETWRISENDMLNKTAKIITLTGATQIITVSKTGVNTPASPFTVTGSAQNTTITSWQYSIDGGSYSSTLPAGVTRSGNVVTINPATVAFKTLTIRASDGTYSDVFTVARAVDGQDGHDGAGIEIKSSVNTYAQLPTSGIAAGDAYLVKADGLLYIYDGTSFPANGQGVEFKGDKGDDGESGYTVLLSNESHTFAGSENAAIAGSAQCQVITYKGATPISATVSVGSLPTGLTASVSGTTITFTASTALTTPSALIPVTIVADGKTFVRQFSYSISFKGAAGASAPLLYVSASAEAMTFDGSNDPKPTTQTINIEAKLQNVTGTAAFSAIPYIGATAQPAITLGGSGNTRTLTQAQWGANVDRIVITATLGSLTDVVTIVKLRDGTAGKGISNSTTTYQVGTSGTTAPTGTWAGTIPSVPAGQYLWTRTIITYTDSTTSTSYNVSRQGESGAAGKGISGAATTYQAGTSGTAVPSGSWTTGVPTVTANQYLWSRTITTYTDSSTSTSYSVGRMGADGKDSVVGRLTNENVTFPASPTGVVTDFSAANGQFKVYEGLVDKTSSATFTKISNTGCIAAISSAGAISVSAMTTDSAAAIFRAVYNGVIIELPLTLSKSKQGVKGDDGISITGADVEFAVNTNATVPPTTGWQTTAPTIADPQQLWTRTKTSYSSGSSTYSIPVNITPKTGTSIVSVTEEYYLSTSKTTPTGGLWSTTQPTWVYGKYLCTRLKMVYANPTSTAYTNPVISSEWEAANEATEIANQALSATQSQAQAIADVQDKTSNVTFMSSGVVNTGVLMVGNGTTNTGFISGVIDQGNNSVILGVDLGGYANKNNAKFRVTLDGRLFATDATITGTIHATDGTFTGVINATSGTFVNGVFTNANIQSGTIAGFTIDQYGITNNNGYGNISIFSPEGTGMVINRVATAPVIDVTAGYVSNRIGVSIFTSGVNSPALYVNAAGPVAASAQLAIESTGGHKFIQREGNIWNAPGILAVLRVTLSPGNVAAIAKRWTVSSLTSLSISQPNTDKSIIRITHNLNHTNYMAIAAAGRQPSTFRVAGVTENSSYCEVDLENEGWASGDFVWIYIFGTNKA